MFCAQRQSSRDVKNSSGGELKTTTPYPYGWILLSNVTELNNKGSSKVEFEHCNARLARTAVGSDA